MSERVTRPLPRPPEEGAPAPRQPSRVTRYLDMAVEDIFNASFHVEAEALIDSRYRVVTGPLGEKGGEASVYRCVDVRLDATVAVKLYNGQMRPKREVVESMLNLHHPNLVALLGFGRWNGLFYEAMEYCHGGTLQQMSPIGEERLRELLPAVLRGLNFCHDAGIVHRDVKPMNLLFRDKECTELALADFGISSLLGEGEDSRKTQSFLRFTLDYCSPEQLRLRKVGKASDYYSLGITLLHLLLGRSPFQGMDEDAVVDAHLQNAVPLPEALSPDITLLVKGLLQHNPKTRWGIVETRAWLSGEAVPELSSAMPGESAFLGQGAPYPAFPEARQPAALATALGEFDALEELQHGRLALWAGLFDQDMGARISALEQLRGEEPEKLLLRLRHILYPGLPLMVDNVAVDSPDALAGAIRSGRRSFLFDLTRQIFEGRVQAWFAGADRGEAGHRVLSGLQYFEERHANRAHLAPYVIYWAIRKDAPLPLGGGVKIRSPEDLAAIVLERSDLRRRFETLLFGGYLLVWLEMTHPDRTSMIEFVRDCMEMQLNWRGLALQGMLWFFNPEAPMEVGGHSVTSPAQLARILCSSKEMRKVGCELLQNGTMRMWLRATGQLQDPAVFDMMAQNTDFSWATRLEMILRLLDPAQRRQGVNVNVEALDFGEMFPGTHKTLEVHLEQPGRGHLWGRAYIPGARDDFSVQPAEFEGEFTVLTVKATPPEYVTANVVVKRTLIIETNAGRMDVPIRYRTRQHLGLFTVEEKEESLLASFTRKLFGK